ncbi:hypothetical protein ACP4OV_010841 [Aristida adscensionis]
MSDQSDDSIDPAEIYPVEEYMAEENVLDSFAQRIAVKIKAKYDSGPSRRQSGPRKYISRNREGAHEQLVADYFAEDPLYSDAMFRRRFRMRRNVFLHIVDALAAICMLAYGTPADSLDEYLKVAETTALDCLGNFVEGVIEVFGNKYLRRPTVEDLEHLLQVGESRGFPGMLGSIDCMHWRWKNCPVGWKGQHVRGDHGVPTIILEAVASQDLHIWHAFFGMAGSNNDINVLNQSPLFIEAIKGEAPRLL